MKCLYAIYHRVPPIKGLKLLTWRILREHMTQIEFLYSGKR